MNPPPNNYIVSGGKTDARDIVNYTDNELLAAKNTRWPRKIVAPGETLRVHWVYGQTHKSRTYRFFITKNGWNENARLTRDSFEQGYSYLGATGTPLAGQVAAPFFSDIHTYPDFWDSRLLPLEYNDVPLPLGKTGHHVLLAVWTIPDGGNAFYQAIDLEFVNQSIGWNAPEYPEWNPSCSYNVGAIVRWKCKNWQTRYCTQGTEPGCQATDGSYPWISC